MGTRNNQCIVYVPGGHNRCGGTNPLIGGNASNMANAGLNRDDIGANIVYASRGEAPNTPTLNCSQKLWNSSTGVFLGCDFPGAIVNGVNDAVSHPNDFCVTVHKRLFPLGCPIP